jgi:hypothetical protein
MSGQRPYRLLRRGRGECARDSESLNPPRPQIPFDPAGAEPILPDCRRFVRDAGNHDGRGCNDRAARTARIPAGIREPAAQFC